MVPEMRCKQCSKIGFLHLFVAQFPLHHRLQQWVMSMTFLAPFDAAPPMAPNAVALPAVAKAG